jgi:CRISPR-associated protein Cst1
MTSNKPLLRWTGHPLADVGVAAICAMTERPAPEAVTLEDLDKVAEEIRKAYLAPIFLSYLSCVYTTNSPYSNPTMSAENREAEVRRVLWAHRGPPDEGLKDVPCAFSGEPATHSINRANMPMLTGSDVMNFFPHGRTELAVAGPYLVALQSLAFGGRRSEGKLLLVHCDDPAWTLSFATRYALRNRKLIAMAQANELPAFGGPAEILDREQAGWDTTKKRPKYPDAKAPQSLVFDDLQEVAAERSSRSRSDTNSSVTVYLLSNSGQGPSLAIFPIPGQLVDFLTSVNRDPYANTWKGLVAHSWRNPMGEVADDAGESPPTEADKSAKKPKKTKKAQKPAIRGQAGRSRNDLFNDLYPIFELGAVNVRAAQYFLRRHFLRDPRPPERRPTNDKLPTHRPQDLSLIDWNLTTLFLKKVIGMNSDHIERIGKFADRLAEVINARKDKNLFRTLVYTRSSYEYRNALSKAQRNYARERNELLFGMDDFVHVFLTSIIADEAVGRVDWALVRDLISIRLVEKLFALDFFKAVPDALKEDDKEDETTDADEPALAS